MSESNAGDTPAQKAETSTPTPAAPAIDVEKVVNAKVGELESKIVREIQGKVASALNPKEEKAKHPFHEKFVNDPEGFVSEIEARATQRAEERVSNRNEIALAVNSIMKEVHEEFPELANVPREIFGEFERTEGSDLKDRLVKASKKVAERLKIDPVSKREKDKEVKSATMAPKGSGGTGAGSSGAKATDAPNDVAFIKSLREAYGKRTGFSK